jgi:cytochrome c biogenesis protein CcmG/thiol:disulfide interchange protein DsbE
MAGLKLFAGVVAACLAAVPALAKDHGNNVNDVAPPYTVMVLGNQKVTSAELKGKVVVLNYWATWCTPCRAEMIAFDKYLRAHPNPDLKIFAISTQDSVPPIQLRALAAATSFPLAWKLAGRGYGIKDAVPTTYVIDRAGVIRHAKAGAFTERSFEALVTPLLEEPAPAAIAAAP